MGGPRSASRWGLLLRMEEEDGGEVVVDGGTEEMDGVRPGSSWVGGGPVNVGESNSPPNSISWLLLMSCSMSDEKKSQI